MASGAREVEVGAVTLAAIESILASHGLRLRSAVRGGVARRWLVEASGPRGTVSGTGVELEDAVENLLAAMKKDVKGRRYAS